MLQLDSRLQTIADMVQPGARLADIGTDHGYLIAYLVQAGVVVSGFACDINPKPLEKAAGVVRTYGLERQIRCVLSNGLQGVAPSSVDTIVIAGMGGDLIQSILEAAPWVRSKAYHLLLQPMTKADHLRDYLAENGFFTQYERAVKSGRFLYTVFSVRYDGVRRELSPEERYIGRVMEGASPDTAAYLRRIRGNLQERLAGLALATEPNKIQQEEYERTCREIEQRLEELEYGNHTGDIPQHG